MFSQLRGKVREPEAMPDIYSDIELEVVIIIVILSMVNAHLSHRHQYDHLYRHYHDPQYDQLPLLPHCEAGVVQVRCLRRWLREMEARIDPLQVITIITITIIIITATIVSIFKHIYSV